MNITKTLSFSLAFLLGLLSTGLYYRLWIWPTQIQHLTAICTPGKLGYPGDWVLDIFFPVIPLIIIIIIGLVSTHKKQS